jgi:copper oxidase (laccase) domain-containing protein
VNVPRTELSDWRERFGLVAGITGKGTASPPFSLGLKSDEPTHVITGRLHALREAMRPAFRSIHLAHQCHGTRIARHQGSVDGLHLLDDTDGHTTADSGMLLAVSVADCVPVYLTRRDGSAFALLHCGWRGTAGGMLEKGIQLLGDAGQLAMHCGVAICGDCYEVGPEVVFAVEGRTVGGKTLFDLRAALARRGGAAGIQDITISDRCTRHHNDRWFSFRAGDEHGRQLAYLGRPLQ